jgi:hypothetical protein
VYGDLSDPRVTFVTGVLEVSSGTTFQGCGILVIRDDYDPNVDTSNTPSIRAQLHIYGTFRWTGLVILAGWAPDIVVASGADATIVGGIFGEDSVQSGGEPSLDTAMVIMTVADDFRLLYSSGVFSPGGLVYNLLPRVRKEVVGVREL